MEALPPRPAARNTEPAPAVTSVTAASKPADPNSSDAGSSNDRSHDQARNAEPDRAPIQNSHPQHAAAASATASDTPAPAVGLSPQPVAPIAGQNPAVSQVTQTPPPPPAAADPAPAPPLPAPVAHQAEVHTPNPAPTAAANDIRVEVPTATGTVDVRVMERGGDVHVAVRTADSHLAGEMRDGLPALSARLEAS